MEGIDLPKFSGNREYFKVYHDKMYNCIVHKWLDMVWSIEPHPDFPDKTFEVVCKSRTSTAQYCKKEKQCISLSQGFVSTFI